VSGPVVRGRPPGARRRLALGLLCLVAGLCALVPASGGQAGEAPAPVVRAPAPPGLNHVYVVLDADTFAALRDHPDVARVLSHADAGLPDFRTPDGHSDRLFFRGRTTYLEFFAPDNRFGEPVGKVGLAIGLDAAAGLDAVHDAWRHAYGADVRRSAATYRRVDPVVPWYDAVQVDATSDNPQFVLWAMTYTPEFVGWISSRDAPSGEARAGSTRRRDALAARWREDQNFVDVVGIAISVPARLQARIAEQLALAGMERLDDAGATRLVGDGWSIVLERRGPEAVGLVHLDLAVSGRWNAGCPAVLGRTTLDSAGGRLRWHFGRATPGSADAGGADDCRVRRRE
jgi:hypothetical protein